MADGFGYGSFSGAPYPFSFSSPSPHPSASAPPFLASHPVESYDPTQGGFDPMISHGPYHRSPASYLQNSRSQTPFSSFDADNSRSGNCGPRGEDSYKDMFSPSGFHSSRESSSDFVPLPTENFSDRQRLNVVPTYNSTTVASLAEMLIRNSQEPFYKPITPSDVYVSSNAFDEKRPGHYHPGPSVEPYRYATDSIPSLPMPSLKTQAPFDGSQTRIHLGDGRSFNSDTFTGVQSSLHGSSVEPVNFDVLLGYGEATGHIKPLSENPDLCYQIVGSSSFHPLQFNIKSSGSLFKEKREGSGVSSLYERPNTLVADTENGIFESESSLKNATEDLNCDEKRSWNHFMVSSEGPSAPTMYSMGSVSCGTIEADNGNAQPAINYKTPSEGCANQPSEDVQANQKPYKLQEQMFDITNRDKKTTLLTDLGIKGSSKANADDRHLCDQGDFSSPDSSPRVSSVVNAMHNLSEVLVYECFNKGSLLKLEQLENLDKVVDNLTKCLKKITGNKTIAGEASLPTQAMHVSCPNVVDHNEASNVVGEDFQGFNVKPLDIIGLPVDNNGMTQSIKNILVSNFPDGEENHPQTLLYKNLWLETEAALCSTTCMARYHRIKNEIGNLKLQNREISADVSTFMQEPFCEPQKSAPIMNDLQQETTESLIKHRSNCGNNVVTVSYDAPQSSRLNSDPMDSLVSHMSRSFHRKFKPDATSGGKIPDVIQQESPASTTEDKHNDVIDQLQILKHEGKKRELKSQNCRDPDIDVIDRFQILQQQETNRKLKSQKCPDTKMGDKEDNPEALAMADIDRSSHVSDVMDRFQILKRREAEQVQKSLNSLNIDEDNDQPRSKIQMHGDPGPASMMTRLCGFNSQIETCVDTDPSASGRGYESTNWDWEHVLKDD